MSANTNTFDQRHIQPAESIEAYVKKERHEQASDGNNTACNDAGVGSSASSALEYRSSAEHTPGSHNAVSKDLNKGLDKGHQCLRIDGTPAEECMPRLSSDLEYGPSESEDVNDSSGDESADECPRRRYARRCRIVHQWKRVRGPADDLHQPNRSKRRRVSDFEDEVSVDTQDNDEKSEENGSDSHMKNLIENDSVDDSLWLMRNRKRHWDETTDDDSDETSSMSASPSRKRARAKLPTSLPHVLTVSRRTKKRSLKKFSFKSTRRTVSASEHSPPVENDVSSSAVEMFGRRLGDCGDGDDQSSIIDSSDMEGGDHDEDSIYNQDNETDSRNNSIDIVVRMEQNVDQMNSEYRELSEPEEDNENESVSERVAQGEGSECDGGLDDLISPNSEEGVGRSSILNSEDESDYDFWKSDDSGNKSFLDVSGFSGADSCLSANAIASAAENAPALVGGSGDVLFELMVLGAESALSISTPQQQHQDHLFDELSLADIVDFPAEDEQNSSLANHIDNTASILPDGLRNAPDMRKGGKGNARSLDQFSVDSLLGNSPGLTSEHVSQLPGSPDFSGLAARTPGSGSRLSSSTCSSTPPALERISVSPCSPPSAPSDHFSGNGSMHTAATTYATYHLEYVDPTSLPAVAAPSPAVHIPYSTTEKGQILIPHFSTMAVDPMPTWLDVPPSPTPGATGVWGAPMSPADFALPLAPIAEFQSPPTAVPPYDLPSSVPSPFIPGRSHFSSSMAQLPTHSRWDEAHMCQV
ncbi:hypothetical protein HK102_006382 [Quaeritorhiza haematococci]|nr:hypothetical protein HK102_006382 [Quaeritorhiza haematococci]